MFQLDENGYVVIKLLKNPISVRCIKKSELNKDGILDFKEWVEKPNSLYVGRNMSFYVPGAVGSKWGNPFTIKKNQGDVETCLLKYKEYIYNNKNLYNSLYELDGKELGCWCVDIEKCHTSVLKKIREEQILNGGQNK